MEITPDRNHEIATLFVYLGDGITFVISGIFVMATRDVYLYLQVLGAVTILCVTILAFTFPESPRYLYSKRRYDELRQCFQMIGRMNKVDDNKMIDNMVDALEQHKHSISEHKQGCFHDIMILYNSPQHFRSLLGVLGLWMYSAFNYYLIGYYVKYFPGDVFDNFMMMTIAEVIAPIVLFMVQGRYVTKIVLRYLLAGASFTSLIYIINQHYGTVDAVPYIILGIRVFVKAAYSLSYYANGKLFPILVKTTIFSLTNAVGRPLSALSSLVTEYTQNPGEIILFTSLAAMTISALFPNSDDTEQEIEKLKVHKKTDSETTRDIEH